MNRTGIFFHYQDGERLRDFPQALEGILEEENVFMYDAFYPGKPASPFDVEAVTEDVLCQVHDPRMVRSVMKKADSLGALYSVAGTVSAATRIWSGDIDNAFVFTGYGDHHAGRDFFGGGCYLNGAAIAIHQLRHRFGVRRVSIVDTDAHHGNGTWGIFKDDPDVLYVCFCSGADLDRANKVNVQVPWQTDDDEYLSLVRKNFVRRLESYCPECVIWNWGYDGTQGAYGDIGLTPGAHAKLARELKAAADRICAGRLIVVLCGGSRRDLAQRIIPDVIRVLAGQEPSG